jgi:hypothetical protein
VRARRAIGEHDTGNRGTAAVGRRLEAPVHGVEVLLDHLQRQVVLPLHPDDVAQPLHVLGGVLPVAGRSPLRLHEALGLEEADLRLLDVRVRELGTQVGQRLADRLAGR